MYGYGDPRYPGVVLDLDHLSPERLRPLRREEYERMVETGLFEDERVELLHGMLVSMSPQGTGHAEAVTRLNEQLVLALQGRARVRPQCSYAASDDSEPEPDLAVVASEDFSREHPQTALLVVEVAESSLRKDRHIKADLYATNGVPEYWIVNLVDRAIEVHTKPQGGRYTRLETVPAGGAIALVSFPDVSVDVDAVLPSVTE